MKLFSKSKDYNNILEEILDKKTFSSISKSLLFSLVYKLEISYRDYEKVKINCLEKDDFFNNILDIINQYCDNLKMVEPESNQAELLRKHKVLAVTNEKERSILTYPTELALLYALADIEPKYFYIKKDFLFKKKLQKILVEGYKQNTIEILNNFSGWSWDINIPDNLKYIYNIIYQQIIIIKDEEFLFSWRKENKVKKDYLYDLKASVQKVLGSDKYLLSLCKILYLLLNDEEKKIVAEKIQKLGEEHISNTSENKKEIKESKNYYLIINNEKNLEEELIELQKYFLLYIEKNIELVQTQEEIIKIIHNLRYYQNIVFTNGKLIKDCDKIKKNLDKAWKAAITKACKLNVIKIISMNIDTNYEIMKYIFDTRIIELENIKINISIEKDKMLLKVYDKEVFEKQKEIILGENTKDIIFKKKRTVKVFN